MIKRLITGKKRWFYCKGQPKYFNQKANATENYWMNCTI